MAELGVEGITTYQVACTSLVSCGVGRGARPLTKPRHLGGSVDRLLGKVTEGCIASTWRPSLLLGYLTLAFWLLMEARDVTPWVSAGGGS